MIKITVDSCHSLNFANSGSSVVVQWLSRVRPFVTPWIAARQASLSITISWSFQSLLWLETKGKVLERIKAGSWGGAVCAVHHTHRDPGGRKRALVFALWVRTISRAAEAHFLLSFPYLFLLKIFVIKY